ncbi:9757_t:CDS:2 [Acaulospora morrowiae]|uniref:rhomboid protease n=1 Tax=Acaulospora morrowiae TaxID=94023 RepID=A0A9N9BYG9_9GLOM|nr:9757_t:CDS:2 [Acaulospora morrowiae]
MSQARRNIPSFTSVTSSFRSYILSLPLLTTSIVCVVIILYVLEALFLGVEIVYDEIDLLPEKFFEGQVWRLFTYPYTHLSLGHILFNLLTFLPLSTTIEHTIGTIEYAYILVTVFTILSGSFYLLGSIIFSYKEVSVGGLNPWVFGVVVWESRELAGRERDLFGLFRVPSHFYPIVLFLLMEIFFPRTWFASHIFSLITGYFYAFGYLSRILPSTSFFSNLESKSLFSHIVGVRGFIKAEEGDRSGWWLPLSNEESLDDTIESPSLSEGHAETGESSNATNNTVQVARSNSPVQTTPLFVVPSSNSSSRSNSPSPETVPLSSESNLNSENVDPLTSQ